MLSKLVKLETGRAFTAAETLNAYLAGKAEPTKRQYFEIIKRLEAFAGVELTAVTEQQATSFCVNWLEQPVMRSRLDSSNCKISKITVVSGAGRMHKLYEFFRYRGLVQHNPFSAAVELLGKAEAGEKRPTEALPRDSVQRLLDSPSAYTAEGQRDRAFLSLLFGGALRINEALHIRLCDIIPAGDGALFVRLLKSKCRNKPVNQEIAPSLAPALLTYRARREGEGAKPEELLIVSYLRDRPAHGYTQQGGLYLFRKLAKGVGLSRTFTPHSARATAITRLLEQGEDMKAVQEFSRHTSIEMVEVYDKRRFEGKNTAAKKLKF